MAGLSRVPFGLLEVLTSNDLTTAFRLQARDVLEALRYVSGNRPLVLGGLEVTAAGGGVSVAPGAVLCDYANGGVSPPRADESTATLGYQVAAAAVELPVPAGDSWYLIEARPSEIDALGSRQFGDQVLGETAPQTIVVSRTLTLELRQRVGTPPVAPALAAGWVPLALVKRHASGGDVVAGEVYDLRPLASDMVPAPGAERFRRHDYAVLDKRATPLPMLQFDIELSDRFGQRLSALAPQIPMAAILEASYAPVPDTWAYLYLCTIGDIAPRTALGRGILVLSPTPPTVQGGRAPSAPIVPVGPWAGLGAVRATCIGCLRFEESALPNVLLDQSCAGGRYQLWFGPRCTVAGAFTPTGKAGPLVPLNAQRAILRGSAGGSSARGVTLDGPSEGARTLVLGLAGGDASAEGSIWVAGLDPATLTLSSTGTGPQLQLIGADL